MGLVCSEWEAKKQSKNTGSLAGVAENYILPLDIDKFISEAILLKDLASTSSSVKACFQCINGGVLQLILLGCLEGKHWQPTPLLHRLINNSEQKHVAWKEFLVQVETAARRGQKSLTSKDVPLHKFSFSLLVSQSSLGCQQQVGDCISTIEFY
jgi:hypothetical protein